MAGDRGGEEVGGPGVDGAKRARLGNDIKGGRSREVILSSAGVGEVIHARNQAKFTSILNITNDNEVEDAYGHERNRAAVLQERE